MARHPAVKSLWLLGPPTPAAIVAHVARLLAGASRTTRIHVLSPAAFVPTSVLTGLVVRSVLLLAGDGLLMVVHRIRFALGVFFFGAHATPLVLNLAAIAADLLRSVVHTVRDDLRIGPIRVGKCVLILGGSVANPLFATGAIGWADIPAGRADSLVTLFVLTRRPARLALVEE